VSSAFRDTLAPSAFHQQVLASLLGDPQHAVESMAGSDWVFRQVDIDRAALSKWHLTLFSMLVFFESGPLTSLTDATLSKTIQTLVSELDARGISPGKLIVTYFGGGVVLDSTFEASASIALAWEQMGVSAANIIPIAGEHLFTNVLSP